MDIKLKQMLKNLEKFETINKEDIPEFVRLVRDLDVSANLAYLQLELNEKDLEE